MRKINKILLILILVFSYIVVYLLMNLAHTIGVNFSHGVGVGILFVSAINLIQNRLFISKKKESNNVSPGDFLSKWLSYQEFTDTLANQLEELTGIPKMTWFNIVRIYVKRGGKGYGIE